jgi:hypothetical protein
MRHIMDVQEPVVLEWRTKCEVQLEMLGVCRSNQLFDYVPSEERFYDCPFTITDSYADKQYYVTPGCLVWVRRDTDAKDGSFYDPSKITTRPESITIDDLKGDPTLEVPFDVRHTGKADALGTWPIVFNSADDVANTQHAALVQELSQWKIDGRNDSVPWRLEHDFVDKVVRHTPYFTPYFTP